MKVYGRVLLASAFVLLGCPGERADTPATGDQPAATTQTGAPGTGTAAAITGTTHEVRMLGPEGGYRYEPAELTIRQGDGVRWVMVSGGPHNVHFEEDRIPQGSRDALSANMPNQMSPLSSPFYMNAGEDYTVSFANLPPGEYNYNCTPHLAMGMRGVIRVQP